jgi:uncharacterized protein YodC (DUF2158 family)
MAEEKITQGDIVVLKSDSPKMTVQRVSEGVALVLWWNVADSKFDSLKIPVHTLRKL